MVFASVRAQLGLGADPALDSAEIGCSTSAGRVRLLFSARDCRNSFLFDASLRLRFCARNAEMDLFIWNENVRSYHTRALIRTFENSLTSGYEAQYCQQGGRIRACVPPGGCRPCLHHLQSHREDANMRSISQTKTPLRSFVHELIMKSGTFATQQGPSCAHDLRSGPTCPIQDREELV